MPGDKQDAQPDAKTGVREVHCEVQPGSKPAEKPESQPGPKPKEENV